LASYRYAVSRRSIIEETFFVEADSWEEAISIANDGGYDDSKVQTEWIDWYDDRFEATEFEPEVLCPLTKMVKEYSCDTGS
jgi:hypothetical protein